MTGTLWARVDVPDASADSLPYRAYEGTPFGTQRPMPVPAVLVIDQQPEGFFLLGYASDGAIAGDTWHRDLEEARGAAAFAYGPYLGTWQVIPAGVEDAAVYALERLAGR